MKPRFILLGLTALLAIACNKTNPEHQGHEYVDLGLSVKWATCNVGAAKPEEAGDYFAWGEAETYYKDGYALVEDAIWKAGKGAGYNWESYRWSDNKGNVFHKYVTDGKYGTVDNKSVLEPADDAAHANWGGKWRMPTVKEWQELRDNCSWTWTSQGGSTGYLVANKITGKSIFLPAVGHRFSTQIYDGRNPDYTDYGKYWTSNLLEGQNYFADCWDITPDNSSYGNLSRNIGLPIRPVIK
ncbi:MAG: hypothetical protein J5737_07720 [Bacteroidales bacterium]|nr:hypothetical protein [Bacteroidales bacterium]